MDYDEKLKEVRSMLKQIEFIDDSEIAIPICCKHEEDLNEIYKCLKNNVYTNANDLSDYAFYLYMKRNHPNRIVKD